MTRSVRRSLAIYFLAILIGPVHGAEVLTYHNDIARTGLNPDEKVLIPSFVNTANFGKLHSRILDGYVYAQPLYVPDVEVPGKGRHNVVYVATEHDSVYAFDADSASGANASPLWRVSFLNPAAGVTTVPNSEVGSGDIVPEIGITSTPVIDPATGTIYIEAKTKEVSGATTSYVHRLHALDIATGAAKHAPVVIIASVKGSGDGNDGNGNVPFNGRRQMNRPGLLLLNGVVYIAYASHGDNGPYHGWVIGYSAQSLLRVAAFNSTPNGGLGGIWMAGGGPACDSSGNMYVITGNGTFDVDSGGKDYGDSFIKLSTSALAVLDYFTPWNQDDLNRVDNDLGSGGVVVLPPQNGATHPNLLVGAGKEGKIYLLNRDGMGHFHAGSDSQIVQSLPGAIGGCFDTPAYFNGAIYYQGVGDVMKAFRLSGGLLVTPPASKSTTSFGFTGATPSISADGTRNGIVWALQTEAYSSGGPAVLHAYDAGNLALELYSSGKNLGRDNPGPAVKFTVPTVVNGKVYVGAQGRLSVFGYLNTVATPTITPDGGPFDGQVSVTLATTTALAQIRYTLDGTPPTAASTLYAGPFTLVGDAVVTARGFRAGQYDSAAAAASFTLDRPPAVRLTRPAEGAKFDAPASIDLGAEATDPDPGDNVSLVEFFQGTAKVGESSGPSFDFTWDGVAAGDYSLTARATDSRGLSAASPPISIHVLPAVQFIRGDSNLDRAVDISDPISILDFLFLGGKPLACLEAADANHSGQVDVSDAIFLFDTLFSGGRPPPPPFPEPGPAPPGDSLGCKRGL